MNLGEILLGACLIGVAMLAFWIALPREGFVRPFLRNDDVQAYYAVVVLGLFSVGLVNIITGVWPG